MYQRLKSDLYRILGTNCMVRLKNIKVNLPYVMRLRPYRYYDANTFYFVISPYTQHPGLSDRLKAIVTCYNFAKRYGYAFKIVFKQPFVLEDYIVPSKVDWIANFDGLHYSLWHTRFFDERSILREDSWIKVRLTPGKEYHCYNYVGNWQPRVYPDTGYAWSSLFHELFNPCKELESLLNSVPYRKGTYVAVHLRFVNALENFEQVSCYDNSLPDEKSKLELINRCKKGIMDIRQMNGGCDILVFSDSRRFLKALDDIPVHTLGGTDAIGHVSFSSSRKTAMKTFLDLYMISRAKKVYRIDAPEIYAYSCFARTGAMIGDIPYETFKV